MEDVLLQYGIREEVMAAIWEELRHQDNKWGADKQQSYAGYLLVLESELAEAKLGWMKNFYGRHSTLAELVQVAATAIRALNAYGTEGCPEALNDVLVDR
jgi:hypothetical protein